MKALPERPKTLLIKDLTEFHLFRNQKAAIEIEACIRIFEPVHESQPLNKQKVWLTLPLKYADLPGEALEFAIAGFVTGDRRGYDRGRADLRAEFRAMLGIGS